MPQSFIVTDPDGNEYNLTVPDGATQEQIQAKVDEVKTHFSTAKATEAFAGTIDTNPTEGVDLSGLRS